MSLTINKSFSRIPCHTNSQINMKLETKNENIYSNSSTPFSLTFERHIISNIFQRIPSIIKTLTNICQILNDYSLTKIKIEEIYQGTNDCILWNENQTKPIAIDQNNYLIEYRQLIRKLIYEFLEFSQDILIVDNKNIEINFMIQKSIKYLFTLNNYRTKRQIAYNYFYHNYLLEDAMLILNNIDKQQYYELRLITLYLRQFFIKLMKFINPKFSVLE